MQQCPTCNQPMTTAERIKVLLKQGPMTAKTVAQTLNLNHSNIKCVMDTLLGKDGIIRQYHNGVMYYGYPKATLEETQEAACSG
jgi:predicted transcriptional regulator